MASDVWHWSIERRLASTFAAVQSAAMELLSYLDSAGWSKNDRHAVHLALEESLVNAIKHGNRRDEAKSIHFRGEVSRSRVRIEIADEGPGFNPSAVPDPTTGENLAKPTGRGVMLMRRFMTRVEYLGRGNRLVMEKDRTPVPEAAK